MLALVYRSLVAHFAGVNDVSEQPDQDVPREGLTGTLPPVAGHPLFGRPAPLAQFFQQPQQGAELDIQIKSGAHLLSFPWIDQQSSALRVHIVAQHRDTSRPLAFRRAADILSRVRSAIISRSNCANDSRIFSVSRPSEVVVLNCWVTETKLVPCCIEDLDDAREVEQRAAEPVHFVDHDAVDPAGVELLQQALQAPAGPCWRR